MTQYDDLADFIRTHPGSTRDDMRHGVPKVTHECEILNRLLSDGTIVRRRVDGKTKDGVWGHWMAEQ